VKRLRIERGAELIAIREEPPRIERELGKLLSAIKAGGPIQAIVDDVKRLEARKLELNEGLENAKEPHPPELMLRRDFAGLFASRSGEVSRPSCRLSKVDKHRAVGICCQVGRTGYLDKRRRLPLSQTLRLLRALLGFNFDSMRVTREPGWRRCCQCLQPEAFQ
jgi:hypothetical protein